MRKALPVIVVLSLLIALFFVAKTFEPTTEAEEANAKVPAPMPTVEVGASQPLQKAPASQPRVKTKLSKKSKVQVEESSEEILNRASKSIVAQAKPHKEAVTGVSKLETPKTNDRFSSRRVRVNVNRHAEPLPDRCDTEACQNSQEGYTLVGLVVSTSPVRGDKAKYFSGDVGLGDAKRKPLVHLK